MLIHFKWLSKFKTHCSSLTSLTFNHVPLPPSPGDRDATHPPSPHVIYDEQPPSAPPSRSASMSEEPVTGDASVRAPTREKAGELQDPVPGRKSTSHQSLPQKSVSKRDPPASHGHGDKKSLLKVENGASHRGRSASPRKSASRYSEDHLETIPGPLKCDPKRRPRDRSSSPGRGEKQSSARAGSGQDPARNSRGRSSSPKKPPRTEGGRDQAGAPAGDSAPPAAGGVRTEPKQSQPGKSRTRSPEKKSKRTDEKSLPSKKATHVAGRGGPEGDKGKRAPSGETSERKLKPDAAEDDSGKEAADGARGSPGRRAPITPGPWKVPSASKASGSAGVAERRL